jgi:hypothetical protein
MIKLNLPKNGDLIVSKRGKMVFSRLPVNRWGLWRSVAVEVKLGLIVSTQPMPVARTAKMILRKLRGWR